MPADPPKQLTVCLVTGDEHTPHCGVKDYAQRLAQELRTLGHTVEVLAPASWSPRYVLAFRRELRARRIDILHLQYPSIGHRSSVVTLHEYTALPAPQRASMHLFPLTTSRLIFTSEFERNAFHASAATPVIPIGSNLDAFPGELPRTSTVLYFGQIRPEKGLEDFLALAALSHHSGHDLQFRIAGSVPPRRQLYYETLRQTAPAHVEWLLDLPAARISELMAQAFAAYLPFADGATCRRGSLIASLTNGLPVLAPVTAATPADLAQVILPAASPAEALQQLESLHRSPAQAAALSTAGKAFAQRFSWAAIAREHERIYREALGHPSTTTHLA
jgi:glycosyltransferase involved in cell wall biosynthesis